MINFGEVPAGAVLPIPFASYASASGASVTLTGLAVTDIEVYKGTSMTQRASDAGYTLMDTDGIDIDGITGIHGFSIDTGDNTDSGFYAVGSYFFVVVSAVTIDGQTVNFIAANFRLKAAESVAGYPKADTSHFGGTAGTFSAGRPEVNTSHVAGTAQTAGDIFARLGAPAGASMSADIAAVKTQTAAIETDTGTDLPATLATIAGYIDTEVAAIKAKTDLIPAAPAAVGDIPTAAAIADAVHDEVVEGTTTLRQSVRLANAALGGKASGLATTTAVYRDIADSKDRITATVDADGNRSAITRDLT